MSTSRSFITIALFLFLFCAFSPGIQAQPPASSPPAPPPAGTVQGGVRLPTAEPGPSSLPTPGSTPDAATKPATADGATASGDERVYLNVQDQDIKDVIRQISKATGKNFIIDDKVRGKVTIMSEKTMSKEEAYQAFLSALEVAGFTTVIGPGGIIKVVALKDAVSAPIPIHVDSTPYTDSYVTRLIALKNISALEMSNAIKGLISKSGNMFAYPATNTLIITDSGTNIDRLMKIIKELDQEGPQQVLEIIPVNYADAKDVAAKVLQLFELDKTGGAAKIGKPGGGAELEEIKDVSKIIADERSNSLIVLASKRAIDKVRGIIAKLDTPLKTGDTGSIHVYYLKYAKATEVAQTLSSITSGKGPPAVTKSGGAEKGKPAEKAAPAVAQFEGGISIGADETTNALIITASAKDYQIVVDELISKLDIPRRQVYLESVVMELGMTKGKIAGVSGFGGGGNKTVNGIGNVGGALQTLFSPAGAGGLVGSAGMLGGLLSRDTVTLDLPKADGTISHVSVPAFAAFLNLLQTYTDSNIVSTPNIMTVDNQKASIEVTNTQYANQTTTAPTAGSILTTPIPFETGLTLEITPQITEGNSVRLEIHQKLSNPSGQASSPTSPPPSTKREITTTVVTMDGQTVVLGGLMQDLINHGKTKVPILGDIPIIGLLFRQSTSSISKSNLLVFITPHVIKDPSDFAEISKMKIEQRNKFIEQNYGKRQQKSIRDTIATHRADLLEYTPVTHPSEKASSSFTPPEQKIEQKTEPEVPKSKSTSQPVSSSNKAPVITARPIGPNGNAGGDLYSSSSSPSQPLVPEKAKKEAKPKPKKKPDATTPTSDAGQKPGATKDSGEIDTAY